MRKLFASGNWLCPALALVLLAFVAAACGDDEGPGGNGGSEDKPTATPTPLPGMSSEVVVRGANNPIALAFAPDGRLFYNERLTGDVRIVAPDGQLRPAPFVHLDDLAYIDPSEWGLIGLAVDPEFESNHYVYILYTQLVRELEKELFPGVRQVAKPIVMRFTEANNLGVDPAVILGDLPETNPSKLSFFVGGNLHFGHDGYLYVSIGEMQDDAAQDLSSVKGKILRVNKEDGSAPADNPFVDEPGADPRVFAYGFLDSFDFTFHPQTGDLYAIDIGRNRCNELNLIVAGENYGWRRDELPDSCETTGSVQAVHYFIRPEYLSARHGGSNSVPMGIEFVSGDVYPIVGDSLLACEFETSLMRRLDVEGTEEEPVVDNGVVMTDCRLDIARDPEGVIYYSNTEEIRRLVGE